MKKKWKIARYVSLAFLATCNTQLYASDFNLPFINSSGLGEMYSGWAASATDASTAYSNPAGLTKIHNPQLVASLLGLHGYTQFKGNANTIPSLTPAMSGTANSPIRAIIPNLYFATPVSHNLVFGLSQNIPFALGTSYPKDSIGRYAATRSQIVVVDLGPSLGFKITDKLSAGVGLDFERLAFTLNQMQGFPLSTPDAEGQNNLSGWGYGMHAGLMYDFSEATRVGLNYNSQVMFHTTGDSTSYTPSTTFRTTNQKANAALPTMAQISIKHDINPLWTVMSTAFYIHWSSFQQLTLKNSMLPTGTTIPITIPFQYHDTFDYSFGLNFRPNTKWILKTGVLLLNTPTNERTRSLQDPVGAGTIVSLGAHYQQNKQLGYDIGYAHAFFRQTAINHVSPIEYASGNSNQSNNILGAQLTWDIV